MPPEQLSNLCPSCGYPAHAGHGPKCAAVAGKTNEMEKQTEQRISVERAAEILGGDRVFGPERIRDVFDIAVGHVPDIPFSKAELERAKQVGAKLILRIDAFEEGVPLTLEKVLRHSPGSLSGEISQLSEENDWLGSDASVLLEKPSLEWKLVQTGEMAPGTEHLSAEAQVAFMEKDFVKLGSALENMSTFWDSEEIVAAGPPREMIEEARRKLPSLETLKTIREALPANAKLPKVVEVVYDQILTGGIGPRDLAVATASRFEAGKGESVQRPLDVGFDDAGVKVHSRRDMRFGRPNALGVKKPGIAIGYIQY